MRSLITRSFTVSVFRCGGNYQIVDEHAMPWGVFMVKVVTGPITTTMIANVEQRDSLPVWSSADHFNQNNVPQICSEHGQLAKPIIST